MSWSDLHLQVLALQALLHALCIGKKRRCIIIIYCKYWRLVEALLLNLLYYCCGSPVLLSRHTHRSRTPPAEPVPFSRFSARGVPNIQDPVQQGYTALAQSNTTTLVGPRKAASNAMLVMQHLHYTSIHPTSTLSASSRSLAVRSDRTCCGRSNNWWLAVHRAMVNAGSGNSKMTATAAFFKASRPSITSCAVNKAK